MKLRDQQKLILSILASAAIVPLYKLRTKSANHTARISELRSMGWDIPAPTIYRTHKGSRSSVYSMPEDERMRAWSVLLSAEL